MNLTEAAIHGIFFHPSLRSARSPQDAALRGQRSSTASRRTSHKLISDRDPVAAFRVQKAHDRISQALDVLTYKDEKGPSSIRRTFQLFQRQCCIGETSERDRETGVERITIGFSQRTDTILN